MKQKLLMDEIGSKLLYGVTIGLLLDSGMICLDRITDPT